MHTSTRLFFGLLSTHRHKTRPVPSRWCPVLTLLTRPRARAHSGRLLSPLISYSLLGPCHQHHVLPKGQKNKGDRPVLSRKKERQRDDSHQADTCSLRSFVLGGRGLFVHLGETELTRRFFLFSCKVQKGEKKERRVQRADTLHIMSR